MTLLSYNDKNSTGYTIFDEPIVYKYYLTNTLVKCIKPKKITHPVAKKNKRDNFRVK